MKPILDKLHNDHLNFAKLLEFLEKQLQLLKDCKRTDLESVLDALRYMKEYPDLIHHPLENVVFKYFLDHYDDVNKELNLLLQEHNELPELTNKLIEMLQAALANEPQEREKLSGYLKEYIHVQKEHMNKEESPVYPVMDSTLSDDDWENINSELVFVKDPMFGDKAKHSYQELLQKVLS